jgi:hypothetical protein
MDRSPAPGGIRITQRLSRRAGRRECGRSEKRRRRWRIPRVRPADRPPYREGSVSGQLESRHFFRTRDTVQHVDGYFGTVMEAQALFATILWDDQRHEEIDQFDPRVAVFERAEAS